MADKNGKTLSGRKRAAQLYQEQITATAEIFDLLAKREELETKLAEYLTLLSRHENKTTICERFDLTKAEVDRIMALADKASAESNTDNEANSNADEPITSDQANQTDTSYSGV